MDGHKPAQSKATTIVQMPSPRTRKEVQSFIGIINYLSKFSLRLTELAEPITDLIKEKVLFQLGSRTESVAMLKKEIIKALVLAYYNP